MESAEAFQQRYNNKVHRRKCILWYIEGTCNKIRAYVLIMLLTISKCIIPCIVDFLPRNSALVHCIRAYVTYRILVGLTCMTESRLEHLRSALKNYQKYCTVSSFVPQLEVCNLISESPGSRARIRKEFRLPEATCLIACDSGHSGERHNW
jgi:hypothetical protein